MDKWRSNWVRRKQEIASKLNSGELEGGYAEGIIILCAVISALSAEVWPGKNIDQKRFVQLLKDYGKVIPETTKISVPLLVGASCFTSLKTEMSKLRDSFMNFDETRVIKWYDVDKTEDEILKICNSLDLNKIRKYSYANILYQEVRCNYMHEYHSGKRADSRPMTTDVQARVSYVNYFNNPNRHIYFHFDWVSDLTISLAGSVDDIADNLPLKLPKTWWVDG